jgi:WD40 repeat protein
MIAKPVKGAILAPKSPRIGPMSPKFSYKAFVSYKHHVSTSFALRLEQALKAYAKPLLSRPIRIFRDEKHLVPGVDLPKLIVDALDASEFLILLASPEAAVSPWVRDEIDHWCRELKRTQNLIVVLTAGEIATDDKTKRIDWAHTNALPAVLEAYLERVPLYVDLRGNDHVDALSLSNPEFKTAVNSITARFRSVDPNDMLGEEIRQHRRNLRLRNGAVSALAALTLVSAITAIVAVEQREEARHQTTIAVSRQYAAEAAGLVEKDLDEAILLAVKAVKTEETFEARSSLFEALSQSAEIEAFLHRVRPEEQKWPNWIGGFTASGSRTSIAFFNQAGNQVALTADTLRLFDLTEAGEVTSRRISPSINNVSTVAYSSVSSIVALGGYDGYISLLNASQWIAIIPPVKISDYPITRLFFNATDDRLFAVSDGQLFSLSVSQGKLSVDEQVHIRDQREDPVERDWTGAPTGRHFADITTNSGDGRLLAYGYVTRVVVWDLSGPIRQQLSFDVGASVKYHVGLNELAFSPGGETLAVDLVAASDNVPLSFVELYTIRALDAITAETVAPRAGTDQPSIRKITRPAKERTRHQKAGRPDAPAQPLQDRVGPESGSAGQTLRYTFMTRKWLDNSRLAFNNTGDHLLIGDRNATFQLIDLKQLDYQQPGSDDALHVLDDRFANSRSFTDLTASDKFGIKVKGLSGAVHDARYSPRDDKLLLGVGEHIILWNPRPPQKLSHILIAHKQAPKSLTFSTDGGVLTLATDDGSVYRWNTHKKPPILEAGNQPSSRETAITRELEKSSLEGWKLLALSTDGTLIALFREGVLCVRNIFTSRELWRTQLYGERQKANPPNTEPGVSFFNDGTRIVVHIFDTTSLTVWNTASGHLVDVFDTSAARQWDLAPALSQDGRWMATAIEDNSIGVVNTVTREVTTVEVSRGSVCSVAFSPNSASLAVSYKSEGQSITDSVDALSHPADYGVLFWNLTEKRWDVPRISTPSPPCHLAFDPTGDRLAIATWPEDYDEDDEDDDDEQVQNRTDQADLPHPALGQDVTPSPTTGRDLARSGVVLVWDLTATLWARAGLEKIMYPSPRP